ncbi:hypothetical protein T11_15150 [Trichinella zimbabwensis]|uniref:Uncharacterized protein n=1 Tax=Trichinella zimbabwensis TaxID=268475 RepID=A0A0V1FZ11_9BILA|nr:hypothetical protein T11_15150 [Trichinella zimbabwensis]
MASHLPKDFACVKKPTLMKHCCNGFEDKCLAILRDFVSISEVLE